MATLYSGISFHEKPVGAVSKSSGKGEGKWVGRVVGDKDGSAVRVSNAVFVGKGVSVGITVTDGVHEAMIKAVNNAMTMALVFIDFYSSLRPHYYQKHISKACYSGNPRGYLPEQNFFCLSGVSIALIGLR